ncbi:MAG TPA: phosphoenolpyruvate carboxykinase (ATP), partial [Phycisphaerae bacterium]|nr:phosphoenolpyruvate carboxykinase (ATP) [Phycisphaerae bacterium]
MIKNKFGIENHGIEPTRSVFWNSSAAALVEMAVQRREGQLTSSGAIATLTGKRTGRSPNDKYIVRDATTEKTIAWGKVNQPMTSQAFEQLHRLTLDHLNTRELFVVDARVGADDTYGIPLRVVTTKAWHALFARQLFRRPPLEELARTQPEWVVLGAPDAAADPKIHGTQSDAYIVADFTRKLILVGGSHYAGEIKKSLFTVMNYVLPEKGVFPMHCSANVGDDGDVALFFGLSGTGKTTLSADPARRLIGDDEHGWSDRGVFTFEGGCYAKCIRLSEKNEPEIYRA